MDPDGYAIGDDITIGAVTYAYAGQVRYSYSPTPAFTPYTLTTPSGWVDIAPSAVIMRGQRTDQSGRRWYPSQVNNGDLLASVQAWETDRGIDWPATTSLPTSDLQWRDGGTGQFIPEGYTNVTCTAGGSKEFRIHNTDDRVAQTQTNVNKYWSRWERQAVTVTWRDTSGPFPIIHECVGSIITPDHVLTAAHCIWDNGTNEPLDPSSNDVRLRVCSYGNVSGTGATCAGVVDIHEGPWGRWGWQPGDDYALLELTSNLVGASDTMDLSKDPRSKIRNDFRMHVVTFPTHHTVPSSTPGTAPCTDNTTTPAWAISNFAAFASSEDFAHPQGVGPQRVRWDSDGSRGNSGSPMFRCTGSDGECDPGDKAYQVAVWAGFYPPQSNRVGPNVPTIREWAIACTGPIPILDRRGAGIG